MEIERSKIGLFCEEINEINNLYEELQTECDKYHYYDGGQMPFTQTDSYEEKIDIIRKKENEVFRTMNHSGKSIVMGGPGSKVRRRK